MHRYVIFDVWMALKLAFKNFFSMLLILFLITIVLFFLAPNINIIIDDFIIERYLYIIYSIIFIILIQSIIIYFANRKYVIDLSTNLITFPRSDIENSIFAIILLYPYWNLMRTITINARDIENIYLDTQRWTTKNKISTGLTADGRNKYKTETQNHVRYTLNITGVFGSANLQFLSRQKRDEVRNAIQQCVKNNTNKNIDIKVAEFN
ncbi:MAG: hypothetical protein AB7U51_12515 [Arcobacter sp.]|uniref:hypothetical protein n=1 Tax=Arcobacter sp. TaxID=1872629 RepID=UPI003D04CC1C